MGAVCAKSKTVLQEDADERAQDAEIGRKMDQEAKMERKVQKLLLLGAGESGKSTIFKQIKVLFQMGFSDSERKSFVPVIHANVYQSIRTLFIGSKEFAESEGENSSKYVLQPENQEDVLYARQQTTGIVETEFSPDGEFKKKGVIYRLFDVGGQRNERRKWMHLFDGVTAVIFCAALSEYDQKLFEEDTQNRMMETKELFDWILKQPWFENTSFLLFLNKFDIFEQKAQKVPLTVCDWFRDYKPSTSSSQEIDHAYEFVKQKFQEVYDQNTPSSNVNRVFSIYKTTALDKNLIKKTFDLVDATLTRKRLIDADLL